MRRARPLQPGGINPEPAPGSRCTRPSARVDAHRLPGGVEDVGGHRDEGPGEVGAEVEDLVLEGEGAVAGWVAVGAVEEAGDGAFLLRGGGRG